jgi:hypothetical protein
MQSVKAERSSLLSSKTATTLSLVNAKQEQEFQITSFIAEIKLNYFKFFSRLVRFFLEDWTEKTKKTEEDFIPKKSVLVSVDKRPILGFESLSAPAKNLILALGDLYLQLANDEDFLISSFCSQALHIASNISTTLKKAKEDLVSYKKLMISNSDAIVSELINDIIYDEKFQNAKILLLHKIQTYLHEDESFLNKVTNANVVGTLLEKNRRLRIVMTSKSNSNRYETEKIDMNTKLNTNYRERMKLRLKKNDLLKQKLSELTFGHSGRLARSLETLRISENEIDENINALNEFLSSSKTSSSSTITANINAREKDQLKERKDRKERKEEKEPENEHNEKIDEDEEKDLEEINSILYVLQDTETRIAIVKKSADVTMCDETSMFLNDLNNAFQVECHEALKKIDLLTLDLESRFNQIHVNFSKSYLTIKNELKEFTRQAKGEQRAIEQCSQSVMDVSRSSHEKRLQNKAEEHCKTLHVFWNAL